MIEHNGYQQTRSNDVEFEKRQAFEIRLKVITRAQIRGRGRNAISSFQLERITVFPHKAATARGRIKSSRSNLAQLETSLKTNLTAGLDEKKTKDSRDSSDRRMKAVCFLHAILGQSALAVVVVVVVVVYFIRLGSGLLKAPHDREKRGERREVDVRELQDSREREAKLERERIEKQRAAEQAVHKHFEESLRLAQQKKKVIRVKSTDRSRAHSRDGKLEK
ncbi:hypothetical protein TSAR_000950 [Trichomalopsis sarcophagae]|uniref:Transmembrane protein n=1 Tax=Trichomalopsis sarcophagae TaxID=543379 RepID=A0A232FC03_9HYME|nr:hypothetical protein TSAR_000950 [Trichomalopsis sarcophagae]